MRELNENKGIVERKKKKAEKEKKGGRTEAGCTAVKQALRKYRQCSVKLKGRKAKAE